MLTVTHVHRPEFEFFLRRVFPGLVSILAVVLLLVGNGVSQTTWYVSAAASSPGLGTMADPFPTIAAGIAAASSGDTVTVAAGTYPEHDLSFLGKAITVLGTQGAAATIVDAQNAGRGFLFESGEGPGAVLEGIGVVNGRAPSGASMPGGHGGGLFIDNASPTIRNCEIRACRAGSPPPPFGFPGGHGGGVAILGGTPRFEGCSFIDNHAGRALIENFEPTAEGGHGGAIFGDGATPVFEDCRFIGNRAGSGYPGGDGGAIYGVSGSWSLVRCVFEGNLAGSGTAGEDHGAPYGGTGGAMDLRQTQATITGCEFTLNHAGSAGGSDDGGRGGAGGALYIDACAVVISDSIVADNASGNSSGGENFGNSGAGGGGVYATASNLELIRTRIESNTASDGEEGWAGPAGGGSGGGVYCTGTLSLRRCRIAGNATGNAEDSTGWYGATGGAGGGIFHDGGLLSVRGCVIQGNTTGVSLAESGFGSTGSRGGGVSANSVEIRSSIIAENITGIIYNQAAGSRGLGGGLDAGQANLIGCTVVSNIGDPSAGGLRAAGTATVINSILRGNGATQIDGAATVSYSNVQGGFAGLGNIDANPLFRSLVHGDYHLDVGSPCIDAGDATIPNLPLKDVDGDPRVSHGGVDMGADEVTLLLHLTQTGPGAPVVIEDFLMTPGNEYFNVFSLDPCVAVGEGPFLGLCTQDIGFLFQQVQQPLGTPVFHFLATGESMSWGPYPSVPAVVDGVLLELTGGALTANSPVTRIVIQ